jgi:iron complex outermembrane recepter protein
MKVTPISARANGPSWFDDLSAGTNMISSRSFRMAGRGLSPPAVRGMLLLAALLLCVPHSPLALKLVAQQGALRTQRLSSIRGIVLDGESGHPVSEAYLLLHPKGSPQSGRDLSVGADGVFLFQKLPLGEYVLNINRAGYRVQVLELALTDDEERNVIVYMQPRAYETGPVIVTGSHSHSRIEPTDELSSVLRGRELDRELGLTLAATLKNETGLAMRAMGPAPARPVIRGLGGDRVVLSEDGGKTTDLSATSPDHAVTIEPFAVERIEVLRGPFVLTKSPSTLGGIVNVVRHEVPQDRHNNILGSVGLYGESANGGVLGSFYTEVPFEPLMFRAEVTGRNAGDMRTPESRLNNSDSRSLDYSAGASHIHDRGFAGVSYRDYSLSYGVPGGFVGAHPKGVDIDLERRQMNFRGMYVLDTELLHDLSVQVNRAYYRHKEYEASGTIGSEFRILNWAGDVRASHHSFGAVTEGLIGLEVDQRDFTVGGFVFTSPSVSTNIAPYLFERLRFGSLSVEAALRYTWNRVTPAEEKTATRIGHIRERSFSALSASATLLYEITDIVHVGANLSRSNRMPTIEELFSEGPHLAAYSYEVGNPDLDIERGFGAELFLYHEFESISFNLNFFRNEISSFIIPRNTGRINYATFLPVYATEGVAALLVGAEAQMEWKATDVLQFEASISHTQGSFRETGRPLPQIPPMKAMLAANYQLGSWRLGLETEMAARQDRVDDFEEGTAGYVILNASVQHSFSTGGQVHNVSLVAENMLDQPYRNHLSRVKLILPEAGVNLRLTYRLFFDV